ncbi:YdeI/OmpD-associated family protein [Massilia sp. CFBP9012]|uniref:YdeI/OmpD-associated family protein n=1 Tax=Massilia sp. CFBP9012 TaxID=3096531 RepID=UPI002A6A2037|nr:YdeI/OmpD-associated family protein [Massilia sp. CFBP9012]MDY0976712.1 YdeI/OmpD-associated family protein [Massilia sp. CFBP9012]
MKAAIAESSFEAALCRPAEVQENDRWTFVVLPKPVSEVFPRRGRTSMQGKLNGHPFQATLEPDGQLSHWFRVPATLMTEAGVAIGDTVTFDVAPAPSEQEPLVPPELDKVLDASPPARANWDATTTIARIDWVHWIESARQAKTRASRVADAGDMLAAGKKRVCCFDPSGFYSKSLKPPREGS